MFCRAIILGSLNCITDNIQVNNTCKYFPQGPHVDQPWLRVISKVHTFGRLRETDIYCTPVVIHQSTAQTRDCEVLLRQGTVKTVYPRKIHSAPPLQLTQKDVPKFNRYFPPQTKLHFLQVHIRTSTLCFETCSTFEDYVLIFCGFFVPMNFFVFIIN